MIRQILQIGAPILEVPTEVVKDINSPQIQELISDLVDTCKELKERSAGLSANQIGEKWSICVCRRTDLEEGREEAIADEKLWEVMVNPKIIKQSDDESAFWEGCLSIGKTQSDTIFGPVWRPETVELEYMNRVGETKKISATGFFSHVIQHELDHLNGILFLSRVEHPAKNLWKSKDLDKYVKKHKKYPAIVE